MHLLGYLLIKNWIQYNCSPKRSEIIFVYENEEEALEQAKELNETAEPGIWYSVMKNDE